MTIRLEVSSTQTRHNRTFPDLLKTIAFTAGFHFAFIEEGGTSLYPTLAQHVTNLEVLRILLSIGPSETMHFQTWQDKAGNATPLTVFDKGNNSSVTFSNLQDAQGETDPEWLNRDPDMVVPDNNMSFSVPKADERRDLIAYLKQPRTN
jgi:hypothetical protein